eukprot:SAG22_NODE_882_length_6687_cov_5.782332_6_plen_351_part_00
MPMLSVPLPLVVEGLGLLWLLRLALSFLGLLVAACLPSALHGRQKPGAVAVVTGATDGIGKAVAKQLYARGYKLVLVSRTMDRLQAARAEIAMSCPGREGDDLITVVQFDFGANAGDDDWAKLAEKLPKEVAVLYNNVGVSYDHAEFLEGLPAAKLDAICEVNMRAMVKLSKLVLPGMLAADNGAIVNIGSAAGSIADPLYSVYSGSKAFVEKFSESMAAEVGGRGRVIVQDHIPYFVATKLAKIRRASVFAPSPETWAAASVGSIGRGGPVVVPYFPHKLQAAALGLIPSFAWNRYKVSHKALSFCCDSTVFLSKTVPSHAVRPARQYGFGVDVRRRALKKLEAKAKKG